MAFMLWDAVPLAYVTTTQKPMKKAKLDLMVQLAALGWVPAQGGQHLEPYTGGARECHFNLSKPLAYFACLYESEELLAKGVVEIHHNASNNYYRCFYLLEGEKLVSCVAALPQLASDEEFKLSVAGCVSRR